MNTHPDATAKRRNILEVEGAVAVSGWKITLWPKDKRCESGGGTLEWLSELSDEQEALDALEDWVATLRRGVLPRSGDFECGGGVGVISQAGKFTWLCRADCYEFETENGYSNGYCYLRAEEVSG